MTESAAEPWPVPTSFPPEPRLTATLDGGDHRLAFVWLAYGSSGYRITLPPNLAARLVEVVNGA